MANRKSNNIAAPSLSSDPRKGLDLSHLDHSLGYALARASITARKMFAEQIQGAVDLRPVELSLLVLVLGNNDASPKDLGKALAVSAPNLTPILDRLVARGVVRRAPSAHDGRAQCIQLTTKGKKLAQKAFDASVAAERGWLTHLTQKQLSTLHALLRRLPSE